MPKQKTLVKSFPNDYNKITTTQRKLVMSERDNNRKKMELNADFELSSKYAVALGYDSQTDNAPIVLAKGQGQIAEKIIQIAIDNNIEIRKDEDLLQILKAVDINEEIPVEAFAAVAEIISYIYQQNGKELNRN